MAIKVKLPKVEFGGERSLRTMNAKKPPFAFFLALTLNCFE